MPVKVDARPTRKRRAGVDPWGTPLMLLVRPGQFDVVTPPRY